MGSVTRQMQVTINPTSKDIHLIKQLYHSSVLRPSQSKTFYGNVTKYHLRRIERLVAAGLIARTHGYIRATAAGLRQAGIEDKPLRIDKHRYEEHAIAFDIASHFPDWKVAYPRELKRQSIVERGSRLCMTLGEGDARYAVYVFTNIPSAAALHTFLTEIGELRAHHIRRVMVFCTFPEIIHAIGAVHIIGVTDCCCLLPYPGGIASFRRAHSPDFQNFMKTLFPGVGPCSRPFAHYEWRGAYITILVHNDLVKRSALIDYITHVQKRVGRRCIAICSPGQEIDLPGVEVVSDRV